MKKFLLTTALSFVFVAPGWAMDEERINSHAKDAVEDAEELTQEQLDMMKATSEVAAEEKAQEAAKDAEAMAETKAEADADMTAAKEMPAEPAPEVVEAPMAEPAAGASPEEHRKWGYTGANAAPYWGTLDPSYEACESGEKQSPINISKFLQEDLPNIEPGYTSSPLVVKNSGHTIEVGFQPGGGFSVGGVQYHLKHAHFHTPSEHYLDGAPYPMELHFVHQADDRTLGVIAAMMKVGEHNPVIEGVWLNTPISTGGEKVIDSVEISAGDLLPASLEYYKYEGSLTTPPCTEGVQWHVLKDPIELSEKQLKAFQALFPVNARPVQALNDRVITGD